MGCKETLLALELESDAAAQSAAVEQQREQLKELTKLAAQNESGAETSAA